mmetsp:Transcript_84/g.334  ORF Transcript_84/g.334 Transcript_84/m.334 type:complete len:288 (+) Transcript_84:1401-2264(+)
MRRACRCSSTSPSPRTGRACPTSSSPARTCPSTVPRPRSSTATAALRSPSLQATRRTSARPGSRKATHTSKPTFGEGVSTARSGTRRRSRRSETSPTKTLRPWRPTSFAAASRARPGSAAKGVPTEACSQATCSRARQQGRRSSAPSCAKFPSSTCGGSTSFSPGLRGWASTVIRTLETGPPSSRTTPLTTTSRLMALTLPFSSPRPPATTVCTPAMHARPCARWWTSDIPHSTMRIWKEGTVALRTTSSVPSCPPLRTPSWSRSLWAVLVRRDPAACIPVSKFDES